MCSGHICRCTGYAPIVAAVMDAAGVLRGETREDAAQAPRKQCLFITASSLPRRNAGNLGETNEQS